MRKLAIVGAGGFGKEVFCLWRDELTQSNIRFEFIGFFDDARKGEQNEYGKVIGTVEDLNNIRENIEVVIAIGNPTMLKEVREKIINSNIIFPNVVHPTSKFLDNNALEKSHGNIFSIDTIVSNNVSLGNFNIFNTRATLGHDVIVGDYNILSPNVQISGEVKIGDSNLFGFNSGVLQQRTIGNKNVLGVGAILLRNIENNGTYIGIPAVKLKF